MTLKKGQTTGGRLGFVGYITFLAAMPGSSRDISKKIGMSPTMVCRLAGEMLAVGLVHRAARQFGQRSWTESYWIQGPGESAPIPNGGNGRRPRPNLIAFASLIRALEWPQSCQELIAETGLCEATVRVAVRRMHALKMVRVGEWERRHGRPIEHWLLGSGPDAPRPRPKPRNKVNGEYRLRNVAKTKAAAPLLALAQVFNALAGPHEARSQN